jgi:hypothetical protein
MKFFVSILTLAFLVVSTKSQEIDDNFFDMNKIEDDALTTSLPYYSLVIGYLKELNQKLAVNNGSISSEDQLILEALLNEMTKNNEITKENMRMVESVRNLISKKFKDINLIKKKKQNSKYMHWRQG